MPTYKTFSLKELAELTQSTLVGNPSHCIHNVADLESAGPEDISFLNKLPFGQASKYEPMMRKSKAGAIFIHPEISVTEGRNFLIHEDPSRAFQQALEAFNSRVNFLTAFEGIHPSAVIHPTAKLGNGVWVGPYAVIDAHAVIADGSHVGAHNYIGPHVEIGEGCLLHPHVTIREGCKIGNRVILQPGVVIGSCGFGYTTDKQGKHTKLNQVGIVTLEDDVEIGANTTLDRSRFKSTIVKRGTKIDNLVQIGHGVTIGEDNIIVALTGIAGSSHTGKHVVLAGQCGIAGHTRLDDGVILSAKTGVDKPLPSGKYGGSPAMPLAEYNRMAVHMRNLDKYVKKIRELELKIEKLAKE